MIVSSDIVGRALFGMHLMCVRKEFYFYFFLFSSVCTICAVKSCVLYYDYTVYLCASLRISLLREVFSRLFDVSRARALCDVPAHRRRRALLRLVMLIIVSRNSLINSIIL